MLSVNPVDIRTDPPNVSEMDELARVRKAASSVQTARASLLAAMVAAHEAGNALRAIAHAAGVSHEQVRLLLRKSQAN